MRELKDILEDISKIWYNNKKIIWQEETQMNMFHVSMKKKS